MESPAFEILKKSRKKHVRIFTLGGGIYEGFLEGFDMHVNVHLRDGYVKSEDQQGVYVGDMLINGGSVACIDIM